MKQFRQILAAVVLLGAESVVAMPIGLRMVFWNNYSEMAADIVVDAGDGKTVSVPRAWIVGRTALVAAADGNAEEAVRNGMAANGRKVWECYVLGLDPQGVEAFRITTFPMNVDGTPDLANLEFEPTQAEWNVPGARPVVKGAATLDGAWQTVTEENKAGFRFFKVVVELP